MTTNDVLCASCERTVPDKLPLCQRCGDLLVADLLTVPVLVLELTHTRAGLARLTPKTTGGRSAETPLPIRAASARPDLGIFPALPTMQGDRALHALSSAVYSLTLELEEHLGNRVPIGAAGLIQIAANNRARTDPLDHDGRQPGYGFDNRPRTYGVLVRVDKDGVEHWRTVRRGAETLTSTPVTLLEQCAVWLACHPLELRRLTGAAPAADEIHHALQRIRTMIDPPREPRPIGPCPTCGIELREHPNDDGTLPIYTRCRSCDTQHEIAAVMREALDAISDRLFTIAEIVRITTQFEKPIGKSTLHRWAQEHRIESRGYACHDPVYGLRITDHPIQPRDPRVYRLGDVLGVARRDQKGTAA